MSDTSDLTPEPSDEAALAEIDLTEFGVTSDFTPENLNLLYKQAHDSLGVVLAAAEAAKEAAKSDNATDPKSIARKRVSEVPVTDETQDAVSKAAVLFFEVIDAHPDQAAGMLAEINSLNKYIADVRDVEIAKMTSVVKAESGVDPNAPDTDDDVAFHRNVFKACRGVLTKLIGVCGILKTPIPATIPTEKNSLGDLVPVLPSLPRGRSALNTASNLGRGSKARRVRYSWTPTGGETMELREGILLSEIAVTIISNRQYRVLSDELAAMFGKDKIDQFSETPWSIEFPTGTLSGHLPKAE